MTEPPDLSDDEVELIRELVVFVSRRGLAVARLAGGLFRFIDQPHPGASSVAFYVGGVERVCNRHRFKRQAGLTVWMEPDP